MANGDDDKWWLNQPWQDDPNTRWITPSAASQATVDVRAGVGGGMGAGSPFTNYVQDRVADRLRAQGYDMQPVQRPASPVSAGGIPTVPIGPDGKPLPGSMPGSDSGPGTPPQWAAMLAQQQAAGRNALQAQPAATPNWMAMLQQQNPSFWDMLMRWIGLRQQQYGPGSATGDGGFFAAGGGPRYVIGGGPATPQARPLTYATDTPAPTATPAAASAPYAAGAPVAPPRWFMPPTNVLNQGNSVWRGPQGQQQLDLSPPPLPYSDWQQS